MEYKEDTFYFVNNKHYCLFQKGAFRLAREGEKKKISVEKVTEAREIPNSERLDYCIDTSYELEAFLADVEAYDKALSKIEDSREVITILGKAYQEFVEKLNALMPEISFDDDYNQFESLLKDKMTEICGYELANFWLPSHEMC